MPQASAFFANSSAQSSIPADAGIELLNARWERLCERYLPITSRDSIWRFNRMAKPREPSQGWKLHISATILEACDLFEIVAPFLVSENAHFKAPHSLDELSKLNCGLDYGYHQVGKFITVYPSTVKQALRLARRLDELTKKFFPISVPFDEQYAPASSVFYRYGAFSNITATDDKGESFAAITNPSGEYVPDDRRRAVPEWLADPFPNAGKPSHKSFAGTPLGSRYRIFQAVTQRGKGGTYRAVDFSREVPRLCIVKEGRRRGELGWNGQDGYSLVKNEFEVLRSLGAKYDGVPQVFDSFEIHGNFYFAMEYVEGKSLDEIMQPRRRRFAVGQVLSLALEIAAVIEKIHRAGWVWNDCKPANLIFTKNGSLRPVDFEGAYGINQPEIFDWRTKGFSKPPTADKTSAQGADLYALGAVIFFLLTGNFYDADNAQPVGKLRRNVPRSLIEVTEKLLFGDIAEISEVFEILKRVKDEI